MIDLETRWFSNVSRGCPLSEYPRPQFVRKSWICLNGLYDYAITSADAEMPLDYNGEILVPFSIESKLSGVQKPILPEQRLWYRRFFTLDDDFKDKKAILHFGAVDWQCRVYINGVLAGEHTGGYCPFSIDITEHLSDGKNELVVWVYDPTDEGWQQRGKQVLETKGFWYTATSGIWQTVWIEPVNKDHIRDIKLLPNIDTSSIGIKTNVAGDSDFQLNVLISADGKEIFSGGISSDASVEIPEQILWSPENPFLYTLQMDLFCNGILCDHVESYFGMRKFSIGNDSKGLPRLLLNNKPYFQRGLLDQGYWCDGILTPPTDEAMIYDIETMKDLGFNMLRKHIKVEPLRWYYHCDRIGMIVWQDMISGGEYIGNILAGVLPNVGINVKDNAYTRFKRGKAEWRENFKQELFEMIDTLYNCVSIGCWVPFNEGWGQFDAKEIGTAVKAYDSSRIVDHASGWHDQGGPELKSIHKYILPVHLPRPDSRPFVLSEFGGYSYIIDGHVWDREKSFGYRIYKDKLKLTAAYKNLIEKQIVPLIEKGLCATVYTQVSDVENEVNGILSYDREIVKFNEEVVRDLNKKLIL